MKSFSFSDLNRQSGDVLDAALAAPVLLTKRGKPKLVVLPFEEYERMSYPRAYTMENMPEHLREELMAGLDEIIARG